MPMGGVAIVVFSDLVDSTALLSRLGDDRMDRVRRAHIDDVTEAVSAAGGRLVKTLGDGTMASFESALGALRAATAIQAAVERLDAAQGGIGIAARVGVAAGEPIADGEDLHGMAVVIASRLSAAAGSGDVLVQDLVGSLVASRDGVRLEEGREYDLKGVPAPVRASRLLWRELTPHGVEDGATAAEAGSPARTDGNAEPSHPIRLPPALAAFAEEPLIGRDREISDLREQTSPRPGRRAVLILGEPGIGKTRHAAAVAAEAHAAGATVVLARCPPETAVPFEPWVRAIGELALAGDEEWCEALAEAAGPELAALVPELGRHVALDSRAGASEMVAAEGARYRLLRGIGAALACAAGGRPLHIVLDDAHWCDPASAQALGYLLDGAPAPALVLVATARDAEMGRGHPVSRVLSDLRRTGDLSEMRLTGLDATGVVALVGARIGRAITPALATRLLSRTAGNPFFAGELACELDGKGALRDGDALDAAPVPDAVTGLVEERLARLDPATERLLTAAATIGPSAPVALAGRAVGLDRAEAEQAARDALSERLVEDVAAAEPTVAFTHALVREALIAETGEAGRARLHLAVARALEESDNPEPSELARHYGLSVELAGAETAIAAYRAAAAATAARHDHEQAAVNLRGALALLPEEDWDARASVLLELGEQELLGADLIGARRSFRAAVEAARRSGDGAVLARAALGFAGDDIGFGWESGADPEAVALLREGISTLAGSEPRLELRMVFRLAYLLIFSDDSNVLAELAGRARELERQIGDAEARVLAGFAELVAKVARNPSPLEAFDVFEEMERSLELVEWAERSGRDDLLFRVVQWAASTHYAMARIPECERAIERAGEIAERLGSPRFNWEVDLYRGLRLLDRGDREGAEALIRRGGRVMRRLRPELHIFVELTWLVVIEWIYGGETSTPRIVYEAMNEGTPRGIISASLTLVEASTGDREMARSQLRTLLSGDLELVRYPDAHLPATLGFLAHAASVLEDREAAARLRPLLEGARSRLATASPAVGCGFLPEWAIGNLELVAGNADAAVRELRYAVDRADRLELIWAAAWSRADLAVALHRAGEAEEAGTALVEAEELARQHGVGWAARRAAEARAEIEGRPPPNVPRTEAGRARPFRALAMRGGRRALAATVRDLDDEALERRFAEPRRQRALVKALARGFQPSRANGFAGTIAYELEPYAIQPPPDAPWRWAVHADADSGSARLLEPAPPDAAVTVHFGLADWVRVVAGTESPLSIMVGGRCSVEGDLTVAARLEAMFGGR